MVNSLCYHTQRISENIGRDINMKRLTLNETWVLCLRKWKWVAEEWEKGRRDIENLKAEWLREHGFGDELVDNDCFFCEYDSQHDDDCKSCPAILVSRNFSCTNVTYIWCYKPTTFYNKLLSMNKKRLEGKTE